MSKPLPKFKGLWLPAALLADSKTSALEKDILADIRYFNGAYNFPYPTMARKFGTSRMSIVRAVESLVKGGRITSEGKTRNHRLGLTEAAEGLFDEKPEPKTPAKQKPFVKPESALQVVEYAATIDFEIDGQRFIDWYEERDWKVGKNKMKDWKAAVRTWKLRSKDNGRTNTVIQSSTEPYIR